MDTRRFIDPKDEAGLYIYQLMNSCVVPRPIAWVSTVDADGVANLAPYSQFNMVSTEPPMIAFVSTRRMKDSSNNAQATGEFVVSIPSNSQLEVCNATATELGAGDSEFEKFRIAPEASEYVAPPRVADAAVSMECRTHDVIEIGNSFLVVGEIVAFSVAERVLNDKGIVDAAKLEPMGKLMGPLWLRGGDVYFTPRPDA